MVQSVEMLLDAEAERSVRGEWYQLVEAGLPSQARQTGSSNRPHITLAVARELSQDQEVAVGAAVSGSLPLPVRLGGLLVFGPGPFILGRLVVPSAQLLALQRKVVAAIGPTSGTFPHQEPGAWTAHVTLARRLSADQLASAAAILSPVAEVPAHAHVIRRWDGDRKVAWTVEASDRVGAGSAGVGADQDPDGVGHHHGDCTQE